MQVPEHDSKVEGHVLASPAVGRAIEILANCRSHEHLPGYLALLRTRLNPKHEFMGMRDIEEFYTEYLGFPDAPFDRPYLRPFLSRGRGARLLNRNLQGSYAPSSIRRGKPFSRIVQLESTPSPVEEGANDVKYVLVNDHANRVLTEMLVGYKVPAISLAVFLFRDRCLCLSDVTVVGLRDALKEFFFISSEVSGGEEIFNTLFRDDGSDYQDAKLSADRATISPCGDGLRPIVSEERAQTLTLTDVGLAHLVDKGHRPRSELLADVSEIEPTDVSEIEPTDTILAQVRAARQLGFAGVILSGPPGTGKSWYAQQVGVALTGQWENVRSVQFHPSYQYEDFVFGYMPRDDGRFELREKEFARICRDAAARREAEYVLVIDEISRSDVVRIFGEALTYIATDKRDQEFTLACGQELAVPKNLFIIATMNSWDKGVDELDVALERRFAEIKVPPDSKVLRRLLERRGVSNEFLEPLIGFFDELQESPLRVQLGHAYFLNCVDVESARHVWDLRLRPTLRRACGLDDDAYQDIEVKWRDRMESVNQRAVMEESRRLAEDQMAEESDG